MEEKTYRKNYYENNREKLLNYQKWYYKKKQIENEKPIGINNNRKNKNIDKPQINNKKNKLTIFNKGTYIITFD